jgi:hypothetical protein
MWLSIIFGVWELGSTITKILGFDREGVRSWEKWWSLLWEGLESWEIFQTKFTVTVDTRKEQQRKRKAVDFAAWYDDSVRVRLQFQNGVGGTVGLGPRDECRNVILPMKSVLRIRGSFWNGYPIIFQSTTKQII